jgi:hypothetical protein
VLPVRHKRNFYVFRRTRVFRGFSLTGSGSLAKVKALTGPEQHWGCTFGPVEVSVVGATRSSLSPYHPISSVLRFRITRTVEYKTEK